jgi:hypothetical protein
LEKINLKDIKFYIGPVSKNVVDTIVDFSLRENYKIGIIASRRQIDWNGGYANNWDTKTFRDYLSDKKKNLIVERDHAGINQGRYDDDGVLSLFVDSSKFDIIHIDPWNYYKNNLEGGINETIANIKSVNALNKNCKFEIGTEESICYFDDIMLDTILNKLKNRLGDLFYNIVYCVIQSGTSLKGTKNTGKFDQNRLEKMLKVCDKYGILTKEHNGDYLNVEDIKTRFNAGLSAINIAPEFGVFETDILLENMTEKEKNRFFNICYESNKWRKWVDSDFDPLSNKIELIRICGHYQFSNPKFLEMKINLDDIIKKQLYLKLKKLSEL